MGCVCNDPASHYIKRNIIRKAGNKIRESLGACAVYQNKKKRKEKKRKKEPAIRASSAIFQIITARFRCAVRLHGVEGS